MTSKSPRGRSRKKEEKPDAPGNPETLDAPSAEFEELEAGAGDVEAEETAARVDSVETLRTRLNELEQELAAKEAEASSASERALRTLAEFDNYRRRTERDRARDSARGASEVVAALLDVADNFDRALEHASEDVPEAFLQGMRLVARGLHEILDRHGVSRIESVGAPFDPEVHEALTSQPSDESEPNTVLQEIQPGYMMGDRVLRPAKVIVAAAVASKEDS